MTHPITIKNRERRLLKSKVISLTPNDKMLVIACFYVTKKENITRLAKMFETTEDNIIKVLKLEQLYEYKHCECCGKLKPFSDFFRRCSKSKTTHKSNCKICEDILYNTINRKEYIKNHRLKFRTHPVLYDENKTFIRGIMGIEEIRQNDNGYLEVKCAYCGHWFECLGTSLECRYNYIQGKSDFEGRFYCSDNCKHECPIYWKNEEQILSEHIDYLQVQNNYRNREVQPELRKIVFARDNYTCQKCNKHQSELNVGLHCHHIEGIHWNPIESADIDNCITVCKDCHYQIHKIPGCTQFDMRCPNEFKEK